MTNLFQQFDWGAQFLEKRTRNALLGIQQPFFGKRFLAAARRSCTISRSSLPSQNLITSLAKAIRCSTWKLNGRPRRRHISSSSARCSSDMRMLYRRFFFATRQGCQSKVINTWRKRVDNGRQRLNLTPACFPNVTEKHLDGMVTHAARFYGQMNLANPAKLRAQKGSPLPKGNP